MSTDPTGRVSHIQDMHRGLTWKPAVRCATTATITISTALNNGDTLDGITLATGDRVLVKNQSTASQNGIYIVGATPTRAADMDQDTTTTTIPAEEIAGAVVFVISGTVGASTIWYTTNAVGGTVGSTSITWVQFTGGSVSFATPSVVLGSSAAAGAASTVIRSDSTIAAFDATSPTTQAFGDSAVVGTAAFAARRDHKHAMPTAAVTTSGLTQATAKMLGRSTAATGAIEEITVGSGLSLSAGSLSATGSVGSLTTQNPDASVTGTATTLIFPADHLVFSGGTATFYEDPIRTLFGAPSTAYEFDTSSLAGLTAVGSPTTENANTTILGALFYKDSTNTTAWMMRYQTAPSTPFTAITRLLGDNFNANFNEAALIVGVTNPSTGAFVTCGMSSNGGSRLFLAEKFTNRTTFSSTLATQNVNPGSSLHIYLAMVVNSTTSIDYYYSHGGYVWRKFLSANNPSLTVDSVGVGFKSENSAGAAAAFDFLRLYNSALSLPGA